MSKQRLAVAGWVLVAVVVLVYAPMAFEYTARLFGGGPELWDHAFAGVVGDRRALGAGSIHAVQERHYEEYRWVLLLHTTLGATAIALAVFQLTARSRVRPAVHRRVGRVAVALVAVSMPAAMVFLVGVGPRGTFDGPAFWLQLWALALGTFVATLLGLAAIRARQVLTHRVLMTYAFALLCTAPFLRVGYLVLGAAWPDVTQQVTNLAGASVEAVWAPLAAALASRFVPATPRRDHLRALPGPVADRLVVLGGVVGALALATGYAAAFDGADRITVTAAISFVVALVLVTLNRRATTAGADLVAAEDWRIHGSALVLGLPATALLWGVYAAAFTVEEAFYGALLTGPAVTLSLGVALVAWRRRGPRRAARRVDAVPVVDAAARE